MKSLAILYLGLAFGFLIQTKPVSAQEPQFPAQKIGKYERVFETKYAFSNPCNYPEGVNPPTFSRDIRPREKDLKRPPIPVAGPQNIWEGGGVNWVTHIRRGKDPGDMTHMWGVNICTGKRFEYRTLTYPTVITGFDANPPKIYFANPSDNVNRAAYGRRWNLMVGASLSFPSFDVTVADTFASELTAIIGLSVGLRYGQFKVSFTNGLPTSETSRGNWLAKLTFTPFRRWGAQRNMNVPGKNNLFSRDTIIYYQAVEDLCNHRGVGIRGFDRFRMGARVNKDTTTSDMISFCTDPYRVYKMKYLTHDTYFEEFNNTFPNAALADWTSTAQRGMLKNLGLSVGFGNARGSFLGGAYDAKYLHLGIELIFKNNKWWLDIGRDIPLTRPIFRYQGGNYRMNFSLISFEISHPF